MFQIRFNEEYTKLVKAIAGTASGQVRRVKDQDESVRVMSVENDALRQTFRELMRSVPDTELKIVGSGGTKVTAKCLTIQCDSIESAQMFRDTLVEWIEDTCGMMGHVNIDADDPGGNVIRCFKNEEDEKEYDPAEDDQ